MFRKIKLLTSSSNIKYKRDDLLLIIFPKSTYISAIFTKSIIKAAPLQLAIDNLAKSQDNKIDALIINSGNANAFTGKEGLDNVNQINNYIAEKFKLNKDNIYMSSTGVIGEQLDMEKLFPAIKDLSQKIIDHNFNYNNYYSYFEQASKSIMTTDKINKITQDIFMVNKEKVEIIIISKGAGMICPNMATNLSYIFTNINISYDILDIIFKEVMNNTINNLDIDHDMSTNDTAMIFSDNSANNDLISDLNSKEALLFKDKLEGLMIKIVKKLALDAEGASKFIKLKVNGSKNKESNIKIARSIISSPLVKSAIAGNDPNWGRIIMAIGKSKENINENEITIKFGDNYIIKNSKLIENYDEDIIHRYLKSNNEIDIYISVSNIYHREDEAILYGCDLNEEYVTINKDYRS